MQKKAAPYGEGGLLRKFFNAMINFKRKPQYYIIYNHGDSYPSFMGVQIFQQLVALVASFEGNTQAACNHWGTLLLQAVEYRLSQSEKLHGTELKHPRSNSLACCDIENSLRCSNAVIPLVREPSASFILSASDHIFIEFVWLLNLDEGYLECDICRWSFKSLFKMKGDEKKRLWLEEAHNLLDDVKRDLPATEVLCFTALYQIILIQSHMRRYLAVKAALIPGSGMLFKMQEKKFMQHRSVLETKD